MSTTSIKPLLNNDRLECAGNARNNALTVGRHLFLGVSYPVAQHMSSVSWKQSRSGEGDAGPVMARNSLASACSRSKTL